MGFTGPETKDKKIALVITRSGKWLGERSRRDRRCRRLYKMVMTGMNEEFVMDNPWSKSTTCKINPFITQLIVVGKHKTTKRAGKAMMHRTINHNHHSEEEDQEGFRHSKDRGHYRTLGQIVQ